MTCVSASDCWAVGSTNTEPGSAQRSLIQRWDGTSWAIVASPNTAATDHNDLYDVTCVSASDCWAVGWSGDGQTAQTLIERWDGTSWAIVPSPNTPTEQNVLNGVTCVSGSDCWAVGYSWSGGSTPQQTLIERWDGASWAIVTSPNTLTLHTNSLQDVTCVSASECWAVGHYGTGIVAGTARQTLIQHWDGASWAIVASPNTLPLQHNYLTDVTCVTTSACWAVGHSFSGTFAGGTARTLIERWDGTLWTIVASPNRGATQHNFLTGVSCVSLSTCWAVGTYYVGSTRQTLVQRWNGASWTIVTSPNISTTQPSTFYGMTCVSASSCWAVGWGATSGPPQTLIERWDGASWVIVASPNIGATKQTNFLDGVTCVSASDCWAVGYSHNGRANQTLIERWDGTSWAIVDSPSTSSTQHNFLTGVTCVSASDCWAVGYAYNGTGTDFAGIPNPQTLVERWDGTSWAIVASPNTSTTVDNFLYGVTCVSASDCWTVGHSRDGVGPRQTVIERWDGTSWALIPSPDATATNHNYLTAVTCVSASDCWAAGYYLANNGYYQTLIERWDGTSWAIVTSPNTSTTHYDSLEGVTCASASDCWAVGRYSANSGQQTLIQRWDGTSWEIVPSPNTSAVETNALLDVTCVSASDCWAVGFASKGILIERWDGTAWAIVPSPTKSGYSTGVSSVTCVGVSDCWAVGIEYRYPTSVYQTLTVKYRG